VKRSVLPAQHRSAAGSAAGAPAARRQAAGVPAGQRPALLFVLLVLATSALASGGITVEACRSVMLPVAGATSAYAIDRGIVDVVVRDGNVMLTGRSAGTTQIVVISLDGSYTLPVTVKAPASQVSAALAKEKPQHGSYAIRSVSSSAATQVQSDVDLVRHDGERKTEVHITDEHNAGRRLGGQPSNYIRNATVRITTPKRELTLFDDIVDNSPLTLDGTIVRGIHLRESAWRLHAGYTSNALFGSFLVPSHRELILGGAYAWRLTHASSLVPSVFLYPNHRSVESIAYEFAPDERLQMKSEIGYGGKLGAASLLAYEGDRDHVRADVRWQPRGFAIAGPIDRHGFYSDASWSAQRGRFSSEVDASANRFELARFTERTNTANGELRYAFAKHLAIFGGATYGSFNGVATTRLPIGMQYDSAHIGAGLTWRLGRTSATGRMSNGFGANTRLSLGAFRVNAWVDRQTDAPTLDIIYRDDPALALALAQLGIVANTPQDIARALRENASLIGLGFIEGVTVNLAPLRRQGGLEASWSGAGAHRPELRLRLLRSEVEGVASKFTTSIANLTYSQRLTGSTDVYAGVSRLTTQTNGRGASAEHFVEAGIRQSFDDLPAFRSAGTISGIVFADDEMSGTLHSGARGIGGIDIDIDGMQRTRSDANGRYAFRSVKGGTHRVAARAGAGVYFTTPSAVSAEPSDVVNFGIATTPAHLIGHVVDDTGAGIGGVSVSIRNTSTITTSDGKFTIATAAGQYEVRLGAESLPAGYSLVSGDLRTVTLTRDVPAEVTFHVRANLSIAGRAAPHATVVIPSLARSVVADAEGRFVFRGLPPGAVRIVSGGRSTSVTLPATPTTIDDVKVGR